MGATLARWLNYDAVDKVTEEVEELRRRVDDLSKRVTTYGSNVQDESTNLSKDISSNKLSIGKVLDVGGRVSALEQKMEVLEDRTELLEEKVKLNNNDLASISTRIDVNTARAQINYKSIGVNEDKFREMMLRMQKDIDRINSLTEAELKGFAARKRSIFKNL